MSEKKQKFSNRVTFSQHDENGETYLNVIWEQFYSSKEDQVADGFDVAGRVIGQITEQQIQRVQKGRNTR